jgi:hypothetical protein
MTTVPFSPPTSTVLSRPVARRLIFEHIKRCAEETERRCGYSFVQLQAQGRFDQAEDIPEAFLEFVEGSLRTLANLSRFWEGARPEEATLFLDIMQAVRSRGLSSVFRLHCSQWLDLHPLDHASRRIVIYHMKRLTMASGQIPRLLDIQGVDIGDRRDPQLCGGFADIFQGVYRGISVALKRLRPHNIDSAQLRKVFPFALSINQSEL